MNRAVNLVALLGLVAAALVGGGSSAAARGPAGPPIPLWMRHAERYPGSFSEGVRVTALLRLPRPTGSPGPAPAPATLATSGNVQANAPSGFPQDETAVAFDVFHPFRAVAASNDYQSGGLWIGHTANGGQSWKSLYRSPRFASGARCSGSDPSVVYGRRDHAFYVSTLCFAGGTSQVEVWKSTDDGQSWTPPSKAAVPISNVGPGGTPNGHLFYDKELLAVDNVPTSPHFGRLYVTYIRFHLEAPGGTSDTCPANLAYADRIPTSNPARTSWHHTAVVGANIGGNGTGASANQWATPVVDPAGGLDVAYVSENCNSGIDSGLFFKRSTNGGRTFGGRVRIDKPGQFADNPSPDDLLPHKSPRIGISPSLTVNPVTGSLDYVFQNNENAATSGADISFVQSTDHGRTWSNARTLSVDGVGDPAPKDQFFPWIAADKAGPQGTLQAIWFDNRNDPNDVLVETFQATSTDDGQTWTFQDISSTPWNPNRSFDGAGSFIGDYNGVAASTRVVYPVWTDGRNSTPSHADTDIFTNVEIPGP
jgi:hypothetical protein